MNEQNKKWYIETLHGDFCQKLEVKKSIYSGFSKFQKIEIFENITLGKVLVLDDIVQTSEADEANYHEMLVHVPAFTINRFRKVLIIGGGDGGTLREVLKHQVDEVTLVEIDKDIIYLSKKFLPNLSAGSFNDHRLNIVIDDGSEFIKSVNEKYDLIIVDSTDPIGPGKVLFEVNFYFNCKNKLSKNGIIVTQSGVPFLQPEEFKFTSFNLNKVFKYSGFYFTIVPSYSGGMMALGWGSDNIKMSKVNEIEIRSKLLNFNYSMKYYNMDVHIASFAMPEIYKNLANS